MKTNNRRLNQKGQTLAEMVMVIPLLCLFAAGILQFSLLFLSYVQFEHACGEAAREYAAHLTDKNAIGTRITTHLGRWGRYFDQNSLKVTPHNPESALGKTAEITRKILTAIPLTMSYSEAEWMITIHFRPPYLFAPLFPNGIPFHTVMQVCRYPG
jgi:hypothetical protein